MKSLYREGGYSRFYHHFKDRLKYRYKISVSEDEYIDLCDNVKYLNYIMKNKTTKYIEFVFKGVKIKAYSRKSFIKKQGEKEFIMTAI